MLHMLLMMPTQQRILACAPTNTAILQLASHLVGLFEKSSRDNCYSLGDIVLFGSKDRMKVDKELSKILLKNRVAELSKYLDQKDELKRSVDDLVDFLKNCSSRFRAVPHEKQKNTFKEYFTEAFSTSVKYIATYTGILIDHLPKIFIRADIMYAKSLVEDLQKLLYLHDDESLTRIFEHSNNLDGLSDSEKHAVKIKSGCIDVLMKLQFPKPKKKLEDICLDETKLIFCTPSMSSKLHKTERDILVIDEAANLKECESMIPLAIRGIKHVVLIGDEKQLQSVVKSPIAKEAKCGRSLFERLCEIGYHKHLLNVQYRMHPSISRFPNKNFYDGKIIDGPNVKDHYNSYLPGNIYGTYSFIHIEDGMEEHSGQSSKNMVEAAVAANIVHRLAEACSKQTKRTSVGVISQYAAQVTALQERIGSFENHEFLSVKVQTIDSFQGDEKDIIILSTVRCNRGGNVGFMDSDRRTNVALTRAKNCLWILGHETTLLNSNSIWCSLVDDAKRHRCSFDARADKYLAGTIEEACRKQVKQSGGMNYRRDEHVVELMVGGEEVEKTKAPPAKKRRLVKTVDKDKGSAIAAVPLAALPPAAPTGPIETFIADVTAASEIGAAILEKPNLVEEVLLPTRPDMVGEKKSKKPISGKVSSKFTLKATAASPASPLHKVASVEKAPAVQSVVEKTAEMVVEDTTTAATETAAEATKTTTTEAVVAKEGQTAKGRAEIPVGVVGNPSDYHAEEDIEDALPRFREEESSSVRPRSQVPHPRDIPDKGNIFDDERLEKVWWNRVDQLEQLENSTLVFSTFARTGMNRALEDMATVGEYHRQLMYLRQENAELSKRAASLSKLDAEFLAAALDSEKADSQRLKMENDELSLKLVKATSAVRALEDKINKKETESSKSRTEVEEKTKVIRELNRINKEKNERIKELDTRLAEAVVEIKHLTEATISRQEEMKSMKATLQDCGTLLNNLLGEFGAEKMSPSEDTITAHMSMIVLQVGALGKHLSTMRTDLVESIRDAVNNAVCYALAKLKACNQNLNLTPIDHDFGCSREEAARLIKELEPTGRKIAEEMQLGSPSSE